MKKFLSFFLVISALFLLNVNAYALTFEFYGETYVAEDHPESGLTGIGSATMNIAITYDEDSGSSILTITLENTSPATITVDDTTYNNAPGITGFGLDVGTADDGPPSLISWILEAYSTKVDQNQTVIIGSSELGIDDADWKMDAFMAGVSLDYLPNTVKENIKGALYNPDVETGEAAKPNYYTTAILTLELSGLAKEDDIARVWIRMQNVGIDGDYSLKLDGEEGGGGGGGDPVPEPGTLALLGCGLIALAGVTRKRVNK